MGDYIVKIGTKKQINDHVKELKKVLPDVEVTDNKQAKTLKVMHNGIKVLSALQMNGAWSILFHKNYFSQ